MSQLNLLRQIFSDAHIVDIDFSCWDQQVTIYVLADHVERVEEDRLALFAVEFLRPRSVNIAFNHLDSLHIAAQIGPGEHVQWLIDSCKIDKQRGHFTISLWSLATSAPRMDIVCELVSVRQVAHSHFDQVNPSWDQPRGGLARPAIEVLSALRGKSSSNRVRTR